MNCREFQEEVDQKFRSGSTGLPSELKRHMQACDSCGAYLTELSRLRESLNGQRFEVLPGELDDMTFEKISRLGRAQAEKRAVFSGFRRWAWAPVAVAVIIILAVIPQFSDWVATIYQQNESSGVADIVDEYAVIESDDDLALVVVSLLEDDTDFDRAAEEMMLDWHYDDQIDDLTDGELKALYDRIEMINGSVG